MDWSEIELRIFPGSSEELQILIAIPEEGKPSMVELKNEEGQYQISANPFGDRVHFTLTQSN